MTIVYAYRGVKTEDDKIIYVEACRLFYCE